MSSDVIDYARDLKSCKHVLERLIQTYMQGLLNEWTASGDGETAKREGIHQKIQAATALMQMVEVAIANGENEERKRMKGGKQ